MIGILIIAHGNLGDALINCMTHVPRQTAGGIASMQVAGTDSPRELMPSAQRMINALDEGDGVLLITDIFGASPSNLACKMLVPGRVEGRCRRQCADARACHHLSYPRHGDPAEARGLRWLRGRVPHRR